jgi:tetratricopeptide (TPR) repeat protein/tRNA A-37 threonylcarbamoyl transferase component Bud32
LKSALAPIVYGKYQLLERLARGGMAEVFKAKSHGVEGFEKILVIKRILPGLTENRQFVEMFINEAKIAVSLNHANVVQVFDLGYADGRYFIAMEYVAGCDLATLLERAPPGGLEPGLAVFVTGEVAKALDYAHRRRDGERRPLGLVHRDVSPQNILVSFEGEVKLTDFGIAKAASVVEPTSDAGVVKGKYAYMSPEQAQGRAVDGRSDLFSLGLVLYELLSGDNPFYDEASVYETLARVRAGRVPPLGDRRPELPAELVAIVERALAPEPADRFEDAGSFYQALVQHQFASGQRFGAPEMARTVRRLTEGGDDDAGRFRRDDAALRAVFATEPGAGAAGTTRETPLEVPRRTANPRRRPQLHLRAVHMVRDLAVLVLRGADAAALGERELRSLVERFGGQLVASDRPLDRLALFGLEEPDGREAEEAVRCGHRLLRRAPHLGLGLHCGRVRVRDGGAEPVRDAGFAALLDRAQQLASGAQPGGLWTSEAGRQALEDRFEIAPTGGHGCHRVGAEKRRRSAAPPAGGFVGRGDVLRDLGDRLAQAHGRVRQVVDLVGDAGMGKTRLLHETRRRLLEGQPDVGMLVARCATHRRSVPWSGLQVMLRVLLGVEELDREATVRHKLARLRELGLNPAEVSALATLLGVDAEGEEEPGELASRLRSGWIRVVQRLSEDRLTVLCWDAADRMDARSLGVLGEVIAQTPHHRVAYVLTRRARQRVWPFSGLEDAPPLVIGPMPDEDVAELTAVRLEVPLDAVPATLLREIRVKSGGNPLYVEEYLKALGDAGAIRVQGGVVTHDAERAEIAVPRTLRGIVSSRLARLSAEERRLLQVGAVVGERFTPELLAEVTGLGPSTVDVSLHALLRKDLVQRQGREVDFTHQLVGDVVRDGLALTSRRELHGAVAEAYEALHPDRLDELAERLARHFREAGDRASAVAYLERAARRLEEEGAFGLAMERLRSALELLGQMAEPDRDRMLENYGRIGDLAYRGRRLAEGAPLMMQAVELAEALGRRRELIRFCLAKGRLLANAPGSAERGRQWLDRARTLAATHGEVELLQEVLVSTAKAEVRVGSHRRAIAGFREALELARQLGDRGAQARSLVPLAVALASDGRLEEGLRVLVEARAVVADPPSHAHRVEELKTEGLVRYFAGDHRGAADRFLAALRRAKEHNLTYEVALAAHNVGDAFVRLGDAPAAYAHLHESLELAQQHGWEKLMWLDRRLLGFLEARDGGRPEGRQEIVEANAFAEERGLRWDLIQGRYFLAVLDQQAGDVEGARLGFREVVRLAAEHGHRELLGEAERALLALE